LDYSSKIKLYESEAQVLLGDSIQSIKYCEMGIDGPGFEFADFHSVDHGIELGMLSGLSCYFMWSDQYQQFDLKFGHGTILSQFPIQHPPPIRSLTNHSKWQPYLGKKITGLSSFWPYVNYQNSSAKVRYPQDWKLEFEGDLELIISAMEIDAAGRVVPMADHVTIFFAERAALKYGACRY